MKQMGRNVRPQNQNVVNPNEFRNLVRSFDDLKEEVKRGKKENDEKMRRIVEEQRMGANRRGPQQQDIAAAGQMVKQSIESAHIVPMNIKLEDVQQRQRAMNGQISALARELGEYKQGMKVHHTEYSICTESTSQKGDNASCHGVLWDWERHGMFVSLDRLSMGHFGELYLCY